MSYIFNSISRYFIFIGFFLIYLCFPTNNSTSDAFCYAYSIKWNIELFYPHHLIFNAAIYTFFKILSFAGIKVVALAFIKIVNALMAALSLIVLDKILDLQQVDQPKKTACAIFIGSSYGIMRFATEAECYIVPLFFALWGSCVFIKFLNHQQKRNYLFHSSLLLSISCLFHQMYFFWWIALFAGALVIGNKPASDKFNSGLVYCLPAWIVPLSYVGVLVMYENQPFTFNSLFRYVFTEYYTGNVQHSFGYKSFLLLVINFFRTFVQIHGNHVYLLSKYTWLLIPMAASAILGIVAVRGVKDFNFSKTISAYTRIHIFIFLLYLLFGLYSNGNAEFMSMFPFLICIIMADSRFDSFKLTMLGGSMLVWNLCCAVIPDSIIDYHNSHTMIEKIKSQKNNNYLLKNGLTLMNQFYYEYGHYPPNLLVKNYDTTRLILSKEIPLNQKTYMTDYGKNPEVVTRASVLDENMELLKDYSMTPHDSVKTFYGYHRIYKLAIK